MTFFWSNLTDELYFDTKLIGHAYDQFIVLVDKTGVVNFGFEHDNEYGVKAIKIPRRKIRKGKCKIYYLHFNHGSEYVDLMNKIHVGYDIIPELFKLRTDSIKDHEIYKEIEAHLNEIVLTNAYNKISRLIGLSIDCSDLYYIYKDYDGKVSYDSCVGGFTQLKNKIDQRNYDSFEYSYNYGGKSPPVDEMILELSDDSVYFTWHAPRDGKVPKLQLIDEWFQTKLTLLRRKIVEALQD